MPDLYAEKLIKSNVLTEDTAKKIRNDYMDYLNKELTATSTYEPKKTYFQQQWTGFKVAPDSITYWDTGLDYSLLSYIGRQSVSYPRQFVSSTLLSILTTMEYTLTLTCIYPFKAVDEKYTGKIL